MGFFFGGVVLLYGLYKKNITVSGAGYLCLILAAIGGIIAYFTGESAEKLVKGIAGVSTRAIEPHEEMAGIAIFCIGLTGLLAIQGFIWSLKKAAEAKYYSLIMLAMVLVCFAVVSRTAYLGGKIRHTEFYTNQGNVQPVNIEDNESEDND
jgi:uncharacterized membrane protein